MTDPTNPFKWVSYGLTLQNDMNVKITRRDMDEAH